ncbi:MAG: AbrB/MazE/SpoVT family DNA-binding domain-containing protein [Candidatus Uhrbacteria bacterium]|nr:AbrB/MazE/SpoVT family DNA-binding domain-containing protein [Candidatus Uhrbacteria bacterium]
MQKVSTITSKRQLTIPSQIFRAVGLKEGQRVLIEDREGTVIVKPAHDVVERLAGSVKIPARFLSLGIEEIIRLAKKEYRESRV